VESKPGQEKASGESNKSPEQTPPQREIIPPANPPKSENTANPPGNKPKKRCWRDKRWRHPQVIVNGALALVGIAAAIIYYGQLSQMKKATKAATDGLALTGEMNYIDRRAWITVTKITLVGEPWADPLVLNACPVIRVILRNGGKTPAFDVRTVAAVYYGGGNDVTNWPKKEDSRAMVGPDSDTESDFNGPLLINEAAVKFMKDIPYLFINGETTYCDVFKKRHKTRFCFYRSVQSLKGNNLPLTAWRTGNGVEEKEEGCYKQE
jgi:hypothetical protein